MEKCHFTASKWRIELLERKVLDLNRRIMFLSKSSMWVSIALAIVSLGLFVHLFKYHL